MNSNFISSLPGVLVNMQLAIVESKHLKKKNLNNIFKYDLKLKYFLVPLGRELVTKSLFIQFY